MPHSQQTWENQGDRIVTTGCLVTGSKDGIISTSPLGSCVAVIAYDQTSKTGGVAHVMLPGRSPQNNRWEENRYAENAISNLLAELHLLGAAQEKVGICLVGGANVLRKENDTIAKDLTFSIFEVMEGKKLRIKRTSLGGYERRTAKLNLYSGMVTFMLGDQNEEELFHYIS